MLAIRAISFLPGSVATVFPVLILVAAGQTALADTTASATQDYSLFNPAPDDALRPFCTDRPTKGTGPCTVDAGHLQIESDVFNATFQDDGGIQTNTYIYTSPNFRLGITNDVDAELNISPFVDVETRDRRTGLRTDVSGFGDMFVRVKWSVAGNGAGDFSAALDPFLKVPIAPAGIGNGAVEGGMVVPLQFTLNDTWSLSLVPEIDVLKDGVGAGSHPAGVVSLGVTHAISADVSASAELWANVDGDPSRVATQDSFDLAATWQPPGTVDLQLDIGANLGLNASSPAAQLYAGISHRF
jgi:Putative MetA-pathway of phenol degradation